MATSSGSQSPGSCPTDSGNIPLGAAPGRGPAWGRSQFLASVGMVRQGMDSGGASLDPRSPVGTGNPQRSQAWGTGGVLLPPGPSLPVTPASCQHSPRPGRPPDSQPEGRDQCPPE